MNPLYIGALRHLIQLGAGALGITALGSGQGLELAVASTVSLVNLGWFIKDALKARKR